MAGAAEIAALLAAALGCLQPAIDPMFLTLLSEGGQVAPNAHGLIVGGTQAGAALGGLAVWRFGRNLPPRTFVAAAALACLCSLLSAATNWPAPSGPATGESAPDGFATILMLRCLYGAAMGMVFAHAMALCAARRPNTAYGGMFLLQLLLATLVSLALPALALAQGPHTALALLAVAPALACAALLIAGQVQTGQVQTGQAQTGQAQTGQTGEAPRCSNMPETRIPPAGWALAAATFCAVSATMLVWSFAAALAAAAGIADSVIGEAVALGSLVGAATAFAVMRERVAVPLPVTALLGGVMIASPILLTAPDQAQAFVASIVLLNIGSTALIIRCSGLATATSGDPRFRTFVACTHSLGMIAGPLAGSVLMAGLGSRGLLGGVALVLTACVAATLFAAKQGVGAGFWPIDLATGRTATNSRQSA